jgi:hypothetical protein
VSGRYFYHQRIRETNPIAVREDAQDALLQACQRLSGVALPI